ncbi:MAG: deoxyribodipyrimidine photo-lyase [Candidatus Woesearchaeota archaeon]
MNELRFNKRIKKIKNGEEKGSYVLYWMQGSFRVNYNHSLSFSIYLANKYKKPLLVLIVINPNYPNANRRNMKFFIEGVLDVIEDLEKLKIPYVVKIGDFSEIVEKFSKDAIAIVSDCTYLPNIRKIKQNVYEKIEKNLYEVDTNLVVPVEIASNKREYAAKTIRPKILQKVNEFIDDFETFHYNGLQLESYKEVNNIEKTLDSLKIYDVPSCQIKGGHKNAIKTLQDFIKNKFLHYYEFRNDVKKNIESNLSPYLHFGQISPIEVLQFMKEFKKDKNYEAFFEQLVIRRELAHNFTYYSDHLENLYSLLPLWARKTLQAHENDPREYKYSLEEFEKAYTHDYLWNYAQKQLLEKGKIHNYLRMYWGKKVIEWSKNPEEAYKILVYLNDKYALDGRDPNGYVGILWCFGLHDRPFFERPIFGRVRYMSGRKINLFT